MYAICYSGYHCTHNGLCTVQRAGEVPSVPKSTDRGSLYLLISMVRDLTSSRLVTHRWTIHSTTKVHISLHHHPTGYLAHYLYQHTRPSGPATSVCSKRVAGVYTSIDDYAVVHQGRNGTFRMYLDPKDLGSDITWVGTHGGHGLRVVWIVGRWEAARYECRT